MTIGAAVLDIATRAVHTIMNTAVNVIATAAAIATVAIIASDRSLQNYNIALFPSLELGICLPRLMCKKRDLA